MKKVTQIDPDEGKIYLVLERHKQDKGRKVYKYTPVIPEYDMLKYIRVVRYWVFRHYGLRWPDLEFLLFLKTEYMFDRKTFIVFAKTYHISKRYIQWWIDNGYIQLYREHKGYKAQKALFHLTARSSRIVDEVYKKLLQEKQISEDPTNSIIFRKDAKPVDQRYRDIIRKMNKQREKVLKDKEN
jgi:hypothetical protein